VYSVHCVVDIIL